jgi:hypothetical protein
VGLDVRLMCRRHVLDVLQCALMWEHTAFDVRAGLFSGSGLTDKI